jgi:polysaccharide biosynthesis/export protein
LILPDRRLNVVLLLLVLPLFASRAAAQTSAPTPDSARAVRVQLERERSPRPLLDRPVSRTEYRLGAGDEVNVAIFGDMNEIYETEVSPEGSLLIPGVGIVPVLGATVEEAESLVRAAVGRLYRNVDVRLGLSGVRTFKVYVVGDVPNPGVRVATTATRVSEVIGEGSGPAATEGGLARRRNVTLRRASGETVIVDLVRFRQSGDLAANPTLREGDALLVPTVEEHVTVYGRARFPGVYEYRRDESLAELLDVANGTMSFPADAADSVRVVRFVDAREQRTVMFSRDEATGAPGRAFTLRPFDGIYVPGVGDYMRQRTATVRGEVLRPGVYPIRTDTTTIRDLVEMAGGLTSNASLVQATLRRQTTVRAPRELTGVPVEVLTAEERRILQIQAGSDASFVVVDFQRALAEGESATNQTLRAGDELVIPGRRNDVTVLGAVRTPGIVGYLPGGNVGSYVEAAGGYGRRASRTGVVVLKGPAGTRTHWRDVRSIDPGDTVIVPFRDPTSWSALLRDTNAIVGTIFGLVLAAAAVL